MTLNALKTLCTNSITTGATTSVNDPEYNQTSGAGAKTVEVISASGSPTFSVQPQISIDGTRWYDFSAPITAVGLNTVTPFAPFLRCNITAISGGGVSVYVR